MNRTIFAVPVALLVAASLAFSFGCRNKHRCASPEKRADFIAERLTKELDLNDAQKAQLNVIKNEIVAKFKELRAGRDCKKERGEFHKTAKALIISDEITAKALNQLFDKHEEKMKRKADRMKELRPFIVSKIIEFHKMLTPEQRAKLVEKLDRMCTHKCGPSGTCKM